MRAREDLKWVPGLAFILQERLEDEGVRTGRYGSTFGAMPKFRKRRK